MGKFSDIFSDGDDGDDDLLRDLFESTEAAVDRQPLPAGTYTCRLTDGRMFQARSGTRGYKLTFTVLEGDYAGRVVWHDLWLTEAAMALTKRDLAKLGVKRMEQLKGPVPAGIRCSVKVSLRRSDEGDEFNRVRDFQVLGIDELDADPFAPAGRDRSEAVASIASQSGNDGLDTEEEPDEKLDGEDGYGDEDLGR